MIDRCLSLDSGETHPDAKTWNFYPQANTHFHKNPPKLVFFRKVDKKKPGEVSALSFEYSEELMSVLLFLLTV